MKNLKRSNVIYKYICVVCFLMIGLSAYPQDFDDLKNWELKGNVKSFDEKRYKIEKVSGKWQKGLMEHDGHSKAIFDKVGCLATYENFSSNNWLQQRLIPTRENGKTIEEAYYAYYDKEERLLQRLQYQYRTNDTLIIEWYNGEGEKIKEGIHYRQGYKKIKTVLKEISNGLETGGETVMLFEYDGKGNMKEQKYINEKGDIVFYQRYEYLEFDMNNNWTKRLIYEQEGEPQKIAIREIEYY